MKGVKFTVTEEFSLTMENVSQFIHIYHLALQYQILLTESMGQTVSLPQHAPNASVYAIPHSEGG